jgi:acyl carrier protein
MSQPHEIENELLGFVQREVFAPEINVTVESDLIAAGFDSMSLVRVLVHVETTYGIWVPESELTGDTLGSIRNLSATVARLLNER